jgi:hypothetical protein
MEAREARRLTGAIYGTILLLAVIVGVSEDKDAGPGTVLASVLVTAFAFWAAHVYAAALAERLVDARATWREVIPRVVQEEWPIVEATATPAIALVLGAVGVLSRDAAINIAIALALADLLAWGLAIGRRAGEPTRRAVLIGIVNVAIGAFVVALKVFAH